MQQVLFPVFPEGSKFINSKISVKTIGESVYYFNGEMPIYQHRKEDYRSFRYITSQIVTLNNASQMEIVRFFKVSKESVKRWVKTYKTKGGDGFFNTRKGAKKGNVLTKEKLLQAQTALNTNKSVKKIGEELGVKPDTLRKAIQSGRLTKPARITMEQQEQATKTKSQRNILDSEAVLGMACTNEQGRIEAITKKK